MNCAKHAAMILGFALLTSMAQANTATIRAVVGAVTVTVKGGTTANDAVVGVDVPEDSELIGAADDSSVQIECSSKATQTLTGQFDAVIDFEDPKRGCAVNLRAGTAIATSGPSPDVVPGDPSAGPADPAKGRASIFGPVIMASLHTQFGLTLRSGPNPGTEGFVVDGQAVMRDPGLADEWFVQTGFKIDGETKNTFGIDSDRYRDLATVYARLNINQAGVGASLDETRLRALWLAVLQRPEDTTARVELIEMQFQGSATQSGVFDYELKRAIELASGSGSYELKQRAKKIRDDFEAAKQAKKKPEDNSGTTQTAEPNPPGKVVVH